MGHHFISYSVADAQDFAARLHDELEGGYPKIEAWLDKRDLIDGRDWDTQMDEGIAICDSLLFVMTPDSVVDTSTCKSEWSSALSYKKSIVPLLLKPCKAPFRLINRQYIDFSSDFDAGIAKLRKHIEWLKSPAGELQHLKDRLADAERDLRRAKDDIDIARIKAEMDDFRKQIADKQKVVDNPAGAAQRTQQSIERGLERERQPEKPISGEHRSKFINPPPGIAPDYFQDRHVETKQVADFLRHDRQRLMTIVGRGGVGKTAMVCRLLKGLESGKLPDDLETMPIDGIVYLSETATRRANVANLFSDFGKLLPKEKADELDGVYKNPQASTESKMLKLLEAFPEGRFVLLLDNFEDVLDENRKIKDAELDEALKTILNAPQHAIKVVITTRIAPRELLLIHPERQRLPLELEHGLESPYAENVLREMDADGILRLKSASDATLKDACERVRGYPRALEALVAALAADRDTTLDDILIIADKQLPDNVTQALVGEAFKRLDTTAERVMQALAVYGRPVPEVAVDYLLQPHLPGINSVSVLSRLVNMHFARRESGRFYLHPVDRHYALSLTLKGEDSDRFEAGIPPFTQISLFNQGANYFASTYKPREAWKKLEDLGPQLDEFDLRCEAGDWDTAAWVLVEIDFDYLLLWGHLRLMTELHERLQGKIDDLELQSWSAGNLGSAYRLMGRIDNAIHYIDKALSMNRERKNRQGEGALLGSLAMAYQELGQVEKANGYLEQALAIAREIGHKSLEGFCLGGLGIAYAQLGQVETAIDYFEQSLAICRKTGDKQGEAVDLVYLGNTYGILGQVETAINYYEQSLAIHLEIGARPTQASVLENMGHILVDHGKLVEAIQSYQQAIQIADEIGLPFIQNFGWWGLSLAHLYSGNHVQAREAAEAATKYDVPENNHNVFAALGVIALRQGEVSAARTAFAEAAAKADAILAQTAQYYEALDAKGMALCGLAVLGDNSIEEAKAAFRVAREITKAKGIVGRVLRLFDALAVADTAGILKDVRPIAAGEES